MNNEEVAAWLILGIWIGSLILCLASVAIGWKYVVLPLAWLCGALPFFVALYEKTKSF